MKFAFIAKHRHIWPVSWLCEALDVSRSGFHAWLIRPASAHAIADERLTEVISRSFQRSDRTYGARRVWHDVLAEGIACGLHRVERLMRVNGLRARPRRRGLPKDNGARWSSPTTSSPATFRRTGRTRSGWPTSPTSGPPKAGSTWPSFWTSSRGGS